MKIDEYLSGFCDNNYTTLDDWIRSKSIPFSVDSPDTINAAVDRLAGLLSPVVELLGFGEALHGGEDILQLRNRLFQRLVEKHGYCAIAIESSFPRARAVNDYIHGHGPVSYDAIQETGFSHNFGRLTANRELIEWMRQYNTDPCHPVRLRFYGFDSPTEMTGSDSPRQLLHFVLNYLASVDNVCCGNRRERINQLLALTTIGRTPLR